MVNTLSDIDAEHGGSWSPDLSLELLSEGSNASLCKPRQGLLMTLPILTGAVCLF